MGGLALYLLLHHVLRTYTGLQVALDEWVPWLLEPWGDESLPDPQQAASQATELVQGTEYRVEYCTKYRC